MLKGKVNVGEVIQVKQLVGIEVQAHTHTHTHTHTEGMEGIFFLEDYNDIKKGMPYSELNPDQGVVEFVDGKIKANGNTNYSKMAIIRKK